MRPFFAGPRPLAFAHRGGAALWPENTLVAFRAAIELGITHLETDVHLTRDGHLVLLHDARLERTTDGVGFVRDYTLGELRRLDAGHRFSPDGRSHPWRGKGVVIPTLGEILDLDPAVRVNVEMKQAGVGLERALWRFIEERGVADRLLIASANHRLALELRALARGRVATSASAREVKAFWLAAKTRLSGALPIGYDALQVPVRHRALRVVTPRFIEVAHARGLQVHVWTIDDVGEMRRLRTLGVDGLMSDRPDLLLQALRRD